MISEEIRSIESGKRELRNFGITICIALGLLGTVFLWQERNHYLYFFILSITFLFLGFVLPFLLKPIHKIWMSLAILLGWLMTRVVLSVLFYLVITPLGILLRLFGKDFLNLKFDRNVKSYWIYREKIKPEKRNYENQF
ncbi:MAG: hypothetical protein KJ887_01685 [Candidatus Omnitrophica bacterium]|nr:hypothetical protein [Candidatus Omnitrophota bacterium]MBU1047371.1 hypothetical protein [Candidatus Omnitrophota bacterium]MBU1630873.1 hypothetical protein [Candidatus Omnitrophota bacterium]MBU1766600.1 hypothetical protein [Candidatus Omnitrophota bacterium]MBU1889044.1 hypothetical protein [Candidatus Omnitrophota bacterium]